MSSILTRRDFVKTSAAAAATVRNLHATEKRPNILFIMTDQQALGAVSAHGCRDLHTPNVDRLVRAGVSFQESYCADPLCSPSRSSIFTGRMPSETGVTGNFIHIHPS